MEDKRANAQRKKNREELGQQYTEKYKLRPNKYETKDEEVVSLYKKLYEQLSAEVTRMNSQTLVRIIDSVPKPVLGCSVPLLYPLHNENGLGNLNFLGLSGRGYLEILATLALIGAIFDYLRTEWNRNKTN